MKVKIYIQYCHVLGVQCHTAKLESNAQIAAVEVEVPIPEFNKEEKYAESLKLMNDFLGVTN